MVGIQEGEVDSGFRSDSKMPRLEVLVVWGSKGGWNCDRDCWGGDA